MDIWLIQPAEPTPIDKGGHRLWRTGVTAQLLQAAGHTVTWWSSSFSHIQREFRHPTGGRVEMAPGYGIQFIPALGYKRNVSLRRIKDHRHVASRMRALMEESQPPDIIVASYPTIEASVEAIRFGKNHGVPVVIDVRDQWPDLFYDAFPSVIRPAVRALCGRISREADEVFAGAAAITANADQALDWAIARSRRPKTDLDRAFPMGYLKVEPDLEQLVQAREKLASLGVDLSKFTVFYGGAIGTTGDFDTIVEAAKIVEGRGIDIQWVIAGVGDELPRLKSLAKDVKSVVMPGWLESHEVAALLEASSLGLVPYRDRANFEGGITNKQIEYMAWGLPIVTTLQRGALHDMLSETGSGAFYHSGQPQELADAAARLKQDAEARARMSASAREKYETSYKAETVYQEMIEHFFRVVEAHRSSTGGLP